MFTFRELARMGYTEKHQFTPCNRQAPNLSSLTQQRGEMIKSFLLYVFPCWGLTDGAATISNVTSHHDKEEDSSLQWQFSALGQKRTSYCASRRERKLKYFTKDD